MNGLPDDAATLRRMLVEALAESKRKDERITRLEHQVAHLLRRQFGRRSERVNPNQMPLFSEQTISLLSPAIPGNTATAGTPAAEPAPAKPNPEHRRTGRHGRQILPTALPRRRTVISPTPEELACLSCDGALVKISEVISSRLEYEPATLYVQETVREVWACPPCEGNVVTPDPPPTPLEKSMAGPGLLAQVVVAKYSDHLPLYRQSKIFARSGVELSRKTLCGWVGDTASLVKPIVDQMMAELLFSKVIHSDDTPVPVLDDTRDETRKGRLWVNVGDAEHPHIVFRYTEDRGHEGPLEMLENFSGYLQVDAYAGYDALFRLKRAIEVGCWAHVRRKFFDAQATDPVRALAAIAWIRQLYEVEWAAAEMLAEDRRSLRQLKCPPILEKFKKWLEEQQRVVLPKSPIGDAIGYALNQWPALNRYLEDGVLSIDNNAAERALRGVAVGRKNWLFAGSDEGGRSAAIFYSLIESCKRAKIDPFVYLRDVLSRIATHPARRIAELTPHGWALARRAAEAGKGETTAGAGASVDKSATTVHA